MKCYYQIGSLFAFSIEGSRKKVLYVDRQYQYFRCEKPSIPIELEVEVGSFPTLSETTSDYRVVNRKYYLSDKKIFAEDSYKIAKWKFMIDGLDEPVTHIFFDGNYWSYYILYKFFIEPVLRYKINAKGYLMVHSSAVASEEGAFVFPASPSVGKTSTMLNWLHNGMKFISDEFTILDQSHAYSYTTPLRLHDYNLTANPFVKEYMSNYDKFQIYLRTWIFRLTLGYGDVTHEVDIRNVIKNVEILDMAPIKRVVIFTKAGIDDVVALKVPASHFINKLININKFETMRFSEYLQAYYYIHDIPLEEQFWNKMERNARKIFAQAEYDEFLIPHRYTQKTYQQINEILAI